MLENTFVHIRGIGLKTERKLWRSGFRTWSDFLRTKETILSPGRDRMIRRELELSLQKRNDIRFFGERLSGGEIWRLFGAFRDRAVYLDIESSRTSQGLDEITIVGLYDGRRVQTFVNGINLDEFEVAFADYDLVVTFSGTCFDLPFIRRYFRNISLPSVHIDLRFLLKNLGLTGGLKRIEKEVGLVREDEIDGLNGYEAVMLWKDYQWGDKAALEKLIRYNTADIVNLEPLMEMAFTQMRKRLLP
jgi:hypothetical protein